MKAKKNIFCSKKLLNVKGRLIDLQDPQVMGILNITSDSFFDGGKYTDDVAILNRAERILAEGATFIDIGGYSSRPGALDINEEEEVKRVKNGIKLVVARFPDAIISVDTFRSKVAEAALGEGAAIINDISGGELDPLMINLVSKENVPYIMMHMRGTPQTMKNFTHYVKLLPEILDFFQKKIKHLQVAGVKDIIIDPGFGFAKTIEQNFQLLKNLQVFQVLECPLLVGLSRKSMVYKSLDIPIDEALPGTTVLNTIALEKGASIIRVHDVKEAVEGVKLFKYTE